MAGRNFWVALLGLSAVVGWSQSSTSRADPPAWLSAVPSGLAEAEARVEAALSRRMTLDYVDMPLTEAAYRLQEFAGVNVMVDRAKLNELNIQPDAPVTFRARELPLDAALAEMLRPYELTFLVRNGAVVITTPEDAQSPQNLTVRVYPVYDLVPRGDNSAADELIDLIATTVEPDSWDIHGGPGSIRYCATTGALVFAQRRDIHQQVDALLAALRQARSRRDLGYRTGGAANNLRTDEPVFLSRRLPVRERPAGRILPNSVVGHRAAAAAPASWQAPLMHEVGSVER